MPGQHPHPFKNLPHKVLDYITALNHTVANLYETLREDTNTFETVIEDIKTSYTTLKFAEATLANTRGFEAKARSELKQVAAKTIKVSNFLVFLDEQMTE